ncbi:hypothetical protein A2Z23_01220 [Candidatus Curtissbacteria bacterium RBG_16_39_7]|uniref:YchF C-terminal domain-containing protein n=1 Tax=Candidatus Curtissbacteria bacterium RBG_16_39_7 TaxID=1797707 RepID=A0A1F5G4K2_9BACT|nr:MAG: hypothetical protein A2Z23_01220 [Candidatus Curtissbacteria bacterium RBG_16_39_7]
MKDLETVGKSLEEAKIHVKTDPKLQEKVNLLEKAKIGLEEGKLIKNFLNEEELQEISDLFLLTAKPQLLVLNVSEAQLSEGSEELQIALPTKPLLISAKLESELSAFSEEESEEYLKTSGISQTGLDKIIKESYKLLALITFFTIAKGTQVQAWPLRRGETALRASSLVHSDFERGFITSEVLQFQDLLNSGSWQKAHEVGKIQTCGRDYEVANGDIIEFKAKI